MEIITVPTTPYLDQQPGTSGLRKKTKHAMQPHYIENFVQSVFNVLGDSVSGKSLIIGGDGRYFNEVAIQSIWKIAVANGCRNIQIARDGVAATPAVSAIIRATDALGGFILSASHNPGGLDEDFGIKFNMANGGPAPTDFTEKVFLESQKISSFKTVSLPDITLSQEDSHTFNSSSVQIINGVEQYATLLQKVFDFDLLRDFFKSGFSMRFDAMNAATGPAASHIFEELLGAAPGTVIRGIPLNDFGGAHPDPNLVYAHDVMELVRNDPSLNFGAASDGDGDRNLIFGKSAFVSPGDSLAIIAAYANDCIPWFRKGLNGIARSMPTSCAVDRVAKSLAIPLFETPTGWKFFGSLMDANVCNLCGEESFGTGANHVREKDGLWAVLCWLSILAHTRCSVEELLQKHWHQFGRSYFQRHDFEALPMETAQLQYSSLRDTLPSLVGKKVGRKIITLADDFSYTDPITNVSTTHQGLRIIFEDSSRIILRISGTGTSGATLRIYLESFETTAVTNDIRSVLSEFKNFAYELFDFRSQFNIEQPSVIT